MFLLYLLPFALQLPCVNIKALLYALETQIAILNYEIIKHVPASATEFYLNFSDISFI